MQKTNAAIYYFLYSATIAAFNSFFVLYLENDHGFTAAQVANIVSLNFIIGIFIGPTSAFIHDKIHKKHIMAPIFFVTTGIFMLLLGMAPTDLTIILLLAIAIYTSKLFGPGLVDKLVFELQEEEKLTYSGVRGFAGFGYSLSVLLLSFVVSDVYKPVFWFIAISYLLIAIQVLFLKSNQEPQTDTIKIKDIPYIFNNKRVILVTLLNGILLSTDSVNNFYRGIYVESFVRFDHFSVSFALGLLIFLCAVWELPIGQIARKVLNKFGYKKIFLLTYLTFIIQYIGYFIAGAYQNQVVLYLVAPLHSVTMGLYIPTYMQWIRDSVPKKQFATSLAVPSLFVMIFGTISSRVAGTIRINYEIHFVYLYFIAVLFTGVIIQIIYFRFIDKEIT